MIYYAFQNFGLADRTVSVGETVTTEELAKNGAHVEKTFLDAGFIAEGYKCTERIYVDADGKAVKFDDPKSQGWVYTAGEVIPMQKAKEMGLVQDQPKAEPPKVAIKIPVKEPAKEAAEAQ